jgi:hypothetical protein
MLYRWSYRQRKKLHIVVSLSDRSGSIQFCWETQYYGYIDISADCTKSELKSRLKNLPNFKGTSVNFSEQSQKDLSEFCLKKCGEKFYSRGQQIGKVFYTQGRVYRNKKWQFVHWQGTMTKDFFRKNSLFNSEIFIAYNRGFY